MALAFLGLGSNVGNGPGNLLKAWHSLGLIKKVRPGRLSSPYITKPVNTRPREGTCNLTLSKRWFTNAVATVETDLSPLALLQEMRRIETEQGRDRKKSRDRILDLDLLYYNDLVRAASDLILPHPEIENRIFVLAPLEELAPDFLHPVLLMTTTEMRRQLTDPDQIVKKLTWQKRFIADYRH